MKKITAVLITLIALFIAACDNEGGGNFGEPKDDHIASIAEQRIAIDNSITELRGALSAIKGANILRANTDSVTTRAQSTDDEEINDKISALEIQTDTLQAYIDTIDVDDDWYETTCNTLNIYEQTLQKLVALQIEVKKLKENDKALESKLTEIEKRITACAVSMESWVNNLLTGYYDIATIDGLLTEIKAETTAADSIISQEIKELDTKLETSNQEMTVAYQKAIKEAIEENNGLLAEAAQKAIETINKRIDDAIAGINSRIDDIEKRLSKLEDAVKDLLNRIQSISFIPLYEDETAVVKYPEEGSTKGSTLRMDFLLSPKNTVSDIAKYYDKVLAVKATYLGSTNFINLPIIECTANAEQGILTLTAATDSLSMDFLNGKVNARAMLFISDGNNDLTSDYIRLSILPTIPDNNSIYYTTIDNEPIEFSNETFLHLNEFEEEIEIEIISNVYDTKHDKYVLTFNNDISIIFQITDDRLASIYLPESVTNLINTFDNLKNLTTVRLPRIYIDGNTFTGCNNLKTVLGPLAYDNGRCLVKDNCLMYFMGHNITEYTIPNTIKTIGNNAFAYCEELTSITIPNGITSIGEGAFKNCTGLTSIEIPYSVTNIGYAAFGYCENLTHVKTHYDFTNFKGIFIGCNNITKIESPNISDDGVCIIQNGCLVKYISDKITEYTIPSNVKSIGNGAFGGCSNLTSITIPNSVTHIDEMAFYHCTGLTSIKLSENLTTIYNSLFESCTSLTNITIPNNVETIGMYAFMHCSSLTTIDIPDGIKHIRDHAFHGCALTSINIPNSIKSIGSGAFSGCQFTNVEIPNSITGIGELTFSGCSKLTEVTIPESVTTIREAAFSYCSNLKSVYMQSTTPPETESSAFEGCDMITFYVPQEAVETYKSHSVYGKYPIQAMQ